MEDTSSLIQPYTSVLRNIDTRYGADAALCSVSNIDTAFAAANQYAMFDGLVAAIDDVYETAYGPYDLPVLGGLYFYLILDSKAIETYTYIKGNSENIIETRFVDIGPYTVLTDATITTKNGYLYFLNTTNPIYNNQRPTGKLIIESQLFPLPLVFPNTINLNT